MEGRNRQVMALSQNTSSEHKREWKQLSRWERIRLVAEDKTKVASYKPQEKREVLIPKGNGQTRPIAISCFEDKLVEWVIGKILEQVYEPLFIRNSFGFRPNKSAHQAIEASYYSLKGGKRSHVVEIDFTSCFNSIPHRELIKQLFKRISEDAFIGLIGRFLRVGCLNQLGFTFYWGKKPLFDRLNHFYFQVARILFKWLNRRSQKSSFDWVVFERKLKLFEISSTPPMASLRILGWCPYV